MKMSERYLKRKIINPSKTAVRMYILTAISLFSSYWMVRVRTTYASSALSLLATNGNLAAALDLLQQEVINLLLQSLNFDIQFSDVGIDCRAFQFP